MIIIVTTAIITMIQTTEHRDFRERWQIERGILEGEGAASVDLLEEFICSGDYTTSTYAASKYYRPAVIHLFSVFCVCGILGRTLLYITSLSYILIAYLVL